VTRRDYDKEQWLQLYTEALTELERAKMAGRIGNAREAIVKRVAKLQEIPRLHSEERQAIEDALRSLWVLEQNEERHKVEEKRIAEKALILADKVQSP